MGTVDVSPHDHVVHFYSHDDDLGERVSSYLADAVQAGGVAIAVATPHHRAVFEARLEAVGVDVTEARATGTVILLDARETMARFQVAGRPDPVLFHSVIGELLAGAVETGRPVHAYGEMVSLLWEAGQVNAAIELEGLWNELCTRFDFSLFCAYRFESVLAGDRAEAVRDVCRLHSAVVGSPSTVPAGPDSGPALGATCSFSMGLDGPRVSRRFVAETLAGWGADGLIADASLVVTELVTNAVVHARSNFTVNLACSPAAIRIAVLDYSPARAMQTEPGLAAASGRGLGLVIALSTRWGVEPTRDGKVVWAELAR